MDNLLPLAVVTNEVFLVAGNNERRLKKMVAE